MQSDLKGQRSAPRAKYRHRIWLGGEDTVKPGCPGTQGLNSAQRQSVLTPALRQVAGASQGPPSEPQVPPRPAVALGSPSSSELVPVRHPRRMPDNLTRVSVAKARGMIWQLLVNEID